MTNKTTEPAAPEKPTIQGSLTDSTDAVVTAASSTQVVAGLEPVAWEYKWDKGDDIWRYKLQGEELSDFIPNPHTCTALYSAATVERLVQERDELDKLYGLQFNENNDLVCERKTLKDQLAVLQAREQQLREALEYIARRHITCHKLMLDTAMQALSLPQDDTALKQYGAKLLRDADNKVWEMYKEGPEAISNELNRLADELEQTK